MDGAVTLQAGAELTVGEDGSVKSPGGLQMTAVNNVACQGALAPGGALSIKSGGAVSIGTDALLSVGKSAIIDAKNKLKIYGALTAGSAVALLSGDVLLLSEKANVGGKSVTLTGKTVVRLEGTLSKEGQLVIDGPWLDMPAGAKITGKGAIDVLVPGPKKSLVGGVIDNQGTLIFKAAKMHLQQVGNITSNQSVAIEVADRFDIDGKITKNKGVFIKASQYNLTAGAVIDGNDSCAIQGLQLPGSATPTGCAKL